METARDQQIPSFLKQSRGKIWIRTAILTVFGSLFGLTLYHDISAGGFHLGWAVLIFVLCVPLGYWMRQWVPMQFHPVSRLVTLSFDRIYFVLIWILVIGKALAGYVFGLTVLSDVLMCVILGLMSGRLSGICLRVHAFKQIVP